ncbi:hypothetical protein HY745_05470 [Candidatus Desantisbacteria bacterium]|nr:hypothetical protein [Candidatus Desantisbacteria bacterium]
MPEPIKLDKKVKFNLTFIQEDIRKEFNEYLRTGIKSHHPTMSYSQNRQETISIKLKVIFIVIGLGLFYVIYSQYSNYLDEKKQQVEEKRIQEEKAKKEEMLAEQEKQSIDAKRSIRNAEVAVESAIEKNIESDEISARLLNDAKADLVKAKNAFNNSKYKDCIEIASDALRKVNNSISVYEENMEKKAKTTATQKTSSETKEDKKDTSVKTDGDKTELKKEEKNTEEKKREKEEKINLALKNKALELISNIKKIMSDTKEMALVNKHFSEKIAYLNAETGNIEKSIENNKYDEAIKKSEKILKEITEIKQESQKEEEKSQERAKEALQKILNLQKSLKMKRLEEGK